ncbi:MAG: Ig-like domain-containing protein, partial [Gemmatimonadetes bacterium]|nr:Ig-like domain-containing protein [Candidatus Palauibacter rhopaloidicola]
MATLVAFRDTVRLVAEATDANGHGVAGIDISWSSSDAGVARVDDTGLVEAVAEGTATITAEAGETSGTAEITTVENPERAALVALYEAADGPNWIDNTNWLTDAPLGDWFGVETVREVLGRETDVSRRVMRLRMPDNALAGEIPPELGSLSELQTLDLGGNELTGSIPPQLGSLAKLNDLDLGNNKLTGSIPSELGGLVELRRLWLQDNALTGSIPPELGDLSKLFWMWMGANELTGAIPPELGNLSSLVVLGLSNNKLTGSLPPVLGNLTTLESLSFTGNPLTGVVPRSFLQLNKLDSFSCRRSEGLCVPATDEFRQWAREVQERGAFDLALNIPFCDEPDRSAMESLFGAASGSEWAQSSGWLEDENLGMWHGVQTDSIGRVSSLDLSGNGLSGSVPDALGLLTHMKELRIGNNELVGRLPVSLANVPLEEFDYRGTALCVPDDAGFRGWLNGIPRHFGPGVQCPPLTDRDILASLYWNSDGPNWRRSNGWLTEAPLSAWHGVTTDDAGRVVGLSLSYNRGSGTLPPAIGQLAELEVLNLAGNGLSGEIPAELGKLTQLRILHLAENNLSGSIPAELGDLYRLERLYLPWNQLSGEIPAALGQLSELRQLDLRHNALGGSIPPELGHLSELRGLHLSDNVLGGPIPPELGDLGRLEGLYLSRNRLTDAIPAEVGDLTLLEELDLRSNRLSGRIPPALGNLDEVRYMALFDNQLTGPIPSELGGLAKLDTLNLHDNELSGPLPPELGRAARLQGLNLRSNLLTGPIPPEFAELTLLKQLILADNPGLAGPLPIDMTALGQRSVNQEYQGKESSK